MLVEIKNLVKRFNDNIAVDNVNISIKEGEIFGLLGPNGAGKTTIINTIVGLTKIDGGDIKVFDKNMKTHEMEIKKHIGIVPQDIALYDDMTALENITFFAKLYGLRDGVLKDRAEEALNFTGLWDRRKELTKKFSGGMKRRLNIACAIVHQPKLIIMDEPTVGIDPQSRNHILQSVKKLNEMGSTIIYTSHYMEEVEELCSYITIMDHGRVIAKGTKDELKNLISAEEKVTFELSSVNYTIVDNVKALSGVKDCILDGKNIKVISQKNSKNLGKIIDSISNTDSEILSLNIEKPTLEGVFLTLTGRTLRD
jgi:ABC-2 type transport system ATP-binding protein